MATIGARYPDAPAEPRNVAEPNEKIPPSSATNRYPRPSAAASIPTIGRFSAMLPVEPKNPASPKAKIPPSEATNH